MSPEAEAVTARLKQTCLHWWTFSFWTGVVLAAGVSLLVLGLFVLADSVLRLPQGVLGGLFCTWAALNLAALAFLFVRWRRGKRGMAATARRVELAFPELESHLINIIQFAERDGALADPFRQAALTQAATAVVDFPFEQAATKENRWRRFLLCMQTPRDLLESCLVLAGISGIALLLNAVVPTWGS